MVRTGRFATYFTIYDQLTDASARPHWRIFYDGLYARIDAVIGPKGRRWPTPPPFFLGVVAKVSRPDLESRPPQAPPGHPTATPVAAVRRIRSYAARDRVLGAEDGCEVA